MHKKLMVHCRIQTQIVTNESMGQQELTWIISIMIAKKTFATSVKKLTLIGLNLNFPSTLHIKTRIGCRAK
jgi:hypothetical protein